MCQGKPGRLRMRQGKLGRTVCLPGLVLVWRCKGGLTRVLPILA